MSSVVREKLSSRDGSHSAQRSTLCVVAGFCSLWPRARRSVFRAVVTVVVAAAIGGCQAAASENGPTTSTSALTTTSSPAPTTSSPRHHDQPRISADHAGWVPAASRVRDSTMARSAIERPGSRARCSVAAQIQRQFGGPVGRATPTYPYCQWLVGTDAFLALAVEPRTSFQTATQYVDTLETVRGLGQQAMVANNRYLYFTASGTTYWLLWQQVGDSRSCTRTSSSPWRTTCWLVHRQKWLQRHRCPVRADHRSTSPATRPLPDPSGLGTRTT